MTLNRHGNAVPAASGVAQASVELRVVEATAATQTLTEVGPPGPDQTVTETDDYHPWARTYPNSTGSWIPDSSVMWWAGGQICAVPPCGTPPSRNTKSPGGKIEGSREAGEPAAGKGSPGEGVVQDGRKPGSERLVDSAIPTASRSLIPLD